MTAGQKLVELSGLSSGSALSHLLAITQGTGTGVDRIVFASQMTVCMSEPSITVDRRPAQTIVVQPDSEPNVTSGKKRIDVQTRENKITACSRPESMTVLRTMKPIHLTTTLPRLTVRRKATT